MKQYKNIIWNIRQMEWDNTEIIEYMQEHSQEIGTPKLTRKEKFIAKLERLENLIEKIFPEKDDEPKLLPGNSRPDEISQESWNLSNWGIDKKQFMMDNAQQMEEYSNRPQRGATIEQPMQEQGFTMHSGHEEGFTR